MVFDLIELEISNKSENTYCLTLWNMINESFEFKFNFLIYFKFVLHLINTDIITEPVVL